MRQEFDELPSQVEHIIPRKHHGGDDMGNLALACFACNNHKGPNLSGVDAQTGQNDAAVSSTHR
jgi:5-methylcytosine-specific restriction endonuclease McrA